MLLKLIARREVVLDHRVRDSDRGESIEPRWFGDANRNSRLQEPNSWPRCEPREGVNPNCFRGRKYQEDYLMKPACEEYLE